MCLGRLVIDHHLHGGTEHWHRRHRLLHRRRGWTPWSGFDGDTKPPLSIYLACKGCWRRVDPYKPPQYPV